ncbi:MAG: hypothetical protein K2J87_00960 [Muribaculaceae bacterium]|nr:hypothetical protein [Muribaculaceae bacterium]
MAASISACVSSASSNPFFPPHEGKKREMVNAREEARIYFFIYFIGIIGDVGELGIIGIFTTS